jgi:hypothetical protein
MNVLEYLPTYVKIPSNLKKTFTDKRWKNQLKNKENDPAYDDYSLFYDVFFDLRRKSIWTVGPPFLSLEKEIFPLKVFYKGKHLRYKYHKYNIPEHYAFGFLEIKASSIKEKNPTLTFVGRNWRLDVKVSSFPFSSQEGLTISVLQKDYSCQHIIEWVLWHYRLHQFRRILFYDNGSENIEEVKKALKKLNIPDLEIIIIHWPYYYGISKKFDDLFAQKAQLNHSLKLHYKQKYCISNWDMDDYLVSKNPITYKNLRNIKPYLEMARYSVVNTKKELSTSIRDCVVREKIAVDAKYFFHSDGVKYIYDVHYFVNNDYRRPAPVFSFYFQVIRWIYIEIKKFQSQYHQRVKFFIFGLLSEWRAKRKIPEGTYLIHARNITIRWKNEQAYVDYPLRSIFDSELHIQDENIQEHLKRAGFTKENIF